MDIITLDWKSNISRQLKQHNCQRNGYDNIIQQCSYFSLEFFFHSLNYID